MIVGVRVRDSFRGQIGPIRDIGGYCLDRQDHIRRFTIGFAAADHRRGRCGLQREKGPQRALKASWSCTCYPC